MRILYVGPTFRGSNGTSWRDAFIHLGHEVRSVDVDRYAPWPVRLDQRLLARIRRHPGRNRMRLLNEAVTASAAEFRPGVTFYVHGEYISAETIGQCQRSGLAFAFIGDDILNPINRSPTFDEMIASVDCVFASNSFNVPELRALGVSRVEYSPWAYDSEIHFPVAVSDAERDRYRCDLGFIGTFRPERADYLDRMVAACPGMTIRIWGGWTSMRRLHYRFPRPRWPHLNRSVIPAELWCETYSKAIQSAGIVLGLLNHANRDLHTARSFEIPACGGFMLAERTPEHRTYFEEDREAVFFTGFDEMIDKIAYYGKHESKRKAIAEAGFQRCVNSPYRYTDRAETVLTVAEAMLRGTRS